MTILDMPQGTPEWLQARAGRFTASCSGEAFARIKSGWAASRRNLALRLALERITGKPQESGFVTPAMERGTALEDDARRAYESLTGAMATQVGFILHDELLAGGSPDGLVDDDGLLELKAPGAAAHLDYLKGEIPLAHRLQITHLLWLTGRSWGDLVSYHPDFPPTLRLAVRRVQPSGDDLRAYDRDARVFLAEVDDDYSALMTLADPAGRLAAAVMERV
jgi:hypothetical protein